MKKTSRLAALLMCLALMLCCFTACKSSKGSASSSNVPAGTNMDNIDSVIDSAKPEGSYKIGIVLLVENGAFTDMKDGIIAELNAKGYTDDNTEFVYKCASGDTTSLSTICSSMDDGSYNLVFTIATPATQQFVNLDSDTPCFFCAVSAPVAAGVITDMNTPDKNATGTSNAIPVDNIFALSNSLTPDVTKWGLIYCSSEANASNTISACEDYLSEAGIEYETKTVTDSSEVATVTQALISDGCNAIFVPNDSVVQAGVSTLAEICSENKVPTYCSSATTVASGCFATIAIDDKGIGAKTADMAVEYLSGTAVADIPAVVVNADYVSINSTVLTALGVKLDSDSSISVGGTDYEIKLVG